MIRGFDTAVDAAMKRTPMLSSSVDLASWLDGYEERRRSD